jgi:hypothetical protein
MDLLSDGVNPGLGIAPGSVDVRVIARAQLYRGMVVEFDTALSEAQVTDMLVGSAASGYANVRLPTSVGALRGRTHGVVMDRVVDPGQKGTVRIEGIALSRVFKDSGGVPAQQRLSVSTLGQFTADVAGGERIKGICLESLDSANPIRLVPVLLSGTYGFTQEVSGATTTTTTTLDPGTTPTTGDPGTTPSTTSPPDEWVTNTTQFTKEP